MQNRQPLEVKDFDGGVTDNYISGPPNAAKVYDNLLINNHKKPFTRFGSVIRSEAHGQVPTGIKRIGYMAFHNDQLFEFSERNVFYFTTSYQSLLGPSGNSGLGIGTEDNYISAAFWNNHTFLVSDSFCNPMKIFKDNLDVYHIVNAGLPAISAPTVTATLAGANNYIYAFLYYYTYNVEGVTFEDFGSTVEVSLSLTAEPSSNTVNITNIPVISNGSTDNYDTTVIKVKIYRTLTDDTVLRFIGEVTNGTTTYNDSASDASIQDNVEIYTTGDVVDNDPPPPSKFIHVASDIALYGYVKEDGVEIPNRVRQSLKADIDSCPSSFFLDFPEKVMGINSFQGIFIVFCESSTYRVDGFFDEQGRNGLSFLKISDTVGTVSNDSIVQTDNGLIFTAKQGFYFCDGFRVQKISEHLNRTYPTLIDVDSAGRNIVGSYDKINNRVWWTFQRDNASIDNDSCYVLDLQFGIRPESTFTTIGNGTYFQPSFIIFKDGTLYRADVRGYILIHTNDYKTDPAIDQTKEPSNWAKATIIHNYISCAYDFGTTFVRKWVPRLLVTLTNESNISLAVNSINDDGRNNQPLKQIVYNNNIVWGDPNIEWGDSSIEWNEEGLIDKTRFFPAKGLRCNFKQIQLTNGYGVVTNSDTLSTAVLDVTAKTFTLTDTSLTWDANAVGYFISLDNDSYDTQFEVIERTSDTVLTLRDPLSEFPIAGSYKWLLKGYRKNEVLHLLSYVIHYKMRTDSQPSYKNSDSGSNA